MRNIEIERKFLVKDDSWREGDAGTLYIQGYLKTSPYSIRVRIKDSSGFLTIKEQVKDIIRHEYEYPIPFDDAEYMLMNLCEGSLIRKYRYIRKYEDMAWVIDEFLDENQGLIIAELELELPTQSFKIPQWAGQEVSKDSRYLNSSLVEHPFTQW